MERNINRVVEESRQLQYGVKRKISARFRQYAEEEEEEEAEDLRLLGLPAFYLLTVASLLLRSSELSSANGP